VPTRVEKASVKLIHGRLKRRENVTLRAGQAQQPGCSRPRHPRGCIIGFEAGAECRELRRIGACGIELSLQTLEQGHGGLVHGGLLGHVSLELFDGCHYFLEFLVYLRQ
jgi:hypothetical protein